MVLAMFMLHMVGRLKTYCFTTCLHTDLYRNCIEIPYIDRNIGLLNNGIRFPFFPIFLLFIPSRDIMSSKDTVATLNIELFF
jgi:hypothetical protein